MTARTIEAARVGDRVHFVEDRLAFTVQARDERFVVATRRTPFRGDDCPTYTIVDLEQGVRGPDNAVFGRGYVTREDCEARLRELRDPNHYGEGCGPLEVSRRNAIPLVVAKVVEGA